MTPVWKTMTHNGVAFPEPHLPTGLTVKVKGREVFLTPLADEMAYHLAKKKDTPYVKDPVFLRNFMQDFRKELPDWCKGSKFEDVDFSKFYDRVEEEKRAKAAMTKEEKKAQAAARKSTKEELKGKYGRATIDGQEVEIANWMVEPPGLFMGRGCIAADTIIKTELAVKYVQELVPGDLIATHHGSGKMFYKPVATIAQQGIRQVFTLRTRTHSIRATENHPFLSLSVKRTRERTDKGTFKAKKYPATLVWSPLSRLGVGDYVVTTKRYQTIGTSKFSKTPKRIFNHTIITPKLARVLGYYLGDGFITKRAGGENSHINFSEGHPKLVERYTEICRDVFGISPLVANHSGGNSVVISLYSREFADFVESMGVSGSARTKSVPPWIFGLAEDLKCSFLRGYLDADGNFFVNKIRDIEYGSFGFESTNRRLIEELRELAISAGLQVSNLSERDEHGYTGGRSYRFSINEYHAVNRLLDLGEALKGVRTRHYSLSDRSNELRRMWDWSNLHILDSEIFALERVLEIKADGRQMTYDVSMEDSRSPNFAANGFVVHNSHPMRGSWKPRVAPSDVTLNLGEDAPKPPGDWGSIVHDHESIWIARWIDKLTEKEKYVWPHESSDIQQSRNKQKYDKALKIGEKLPKLHSAIRKKLGDRDEKERKIATVCYMIDEVGMRVGDEKDEDEADTVGATTLRVEHIKRLDEQAIEFDFLGKDSVRWLKTMDSPDPALVANMRKFMAGKKPDSQIFDVVNSSMVNRFLSSIVEGLTAKVFRTYHATRIAENQLRSKDVKSADDLEKVYHAKTANLEAAIFCNHKRTPPKNWEESLKKKEQKLAEYQEKGKEERVRKMRMNIELAVKTRDYNLNTSLKSYIDPRVFKSWADYVGLDWKKIYTSSLMRKFAWAAKSRKAWEGAPIAPISVVRNPHAEKDGG